MNYEIRTFTKFGILFFCHGPNVWKLKLTQAVAQKAETAVGRESDKGSAIVWHAWSEDVFANSASLGSKPIFLYLKAKWCHWCHEMERQTFSNSNIVKILQEKFIPIQVDQDSNPALAAQFAGFGWPALVVLSASKDLASVEGGYLNSAEFERFLNDALNGKGKRAPTQAKHVEAAPAKFPASLRETLIKRHYENYDLVSGGIRSSHRLVDSDSIEFSLVHASAQDRQLVEATLNSALKIMDAVWGGLYQYSAKGGWEEPHFEKLLAVQATAIKVYALAALSLGDDRYLTPAQGTLRFVRNFLRDAGGAFYVSQDSEPPTGLNAKDYFKLGDVERRAKGVPVIDKSIYSRQNGMMIESLVQLYATSRDESVLNDAKLAAKWIQTNRALPQGGYRHGDSDVEGPFLSDTLYMGRAFLALYSATGERAYLESAVKSGNFIIEHFIPNSDVSHAVGMTSSSVLGKSVLPPNPSLQENIDAARFMNLLSRYTGDKQQRAAAEVALRYLSISEVALQNLVETGIVLAADEVGNLPLHITIVGKRADSGTTALHLEAQKYFSTYKRLDLWDRSEGPMLNPDVEYPELPKPAAFICTDRRCSLPVFAAEKLAPMIKSILGAAGTQ